MEKQPKLYKYLFATSKDIQGRVKCFILEIFFFLFLGHFNKDKILLCATLSPCNQRLENLLIHTKQEDFAARKTKYYVSYTFTSIIFLLCSCWSITRLKTGISKQLMNAGSQNLSSIFTFLGFVFMNFLTFDKNKKRNILSGKVYTSKCRLLYQFGEAQWCDICWCTSQSDFSEKKLPGRL